MRSAAVASSHGWNPLAYLALEEGDMRLAQKVLQEAVRLEEERERGRLDYLASKTAAMTAQAITKWLGRNLPKLLGQK